MLAILSPCRFSGRVNSDIWRNFLPCYIFSCFEQRETKQPYYRNGTSILLPHSPFGKKFCFFGDISIYLRNYRIIAFLSFDLQRIYAFWQQRKRYFPQNEAIFSSRVGSPKFSCNKWICDNIRWRSVQVETFVGKRMPSWKYKPLKTIILDVFWAKG